MKIIVYRRSTGSELASLRHLSVLRRTDSLKRFQTRLKELTAKAKARALSGKSATSILAQH